MDEKDGRALARRLVGDLDAVRIEFVHGPRTYANRPSKQASSRITWHRAQHRISRTRWGWPAIEIGARNSCASGRCRPSTTRMSSSTWVRRYRNRLPLLLDALQASTRSWRPDQSMPAQAAWHDRLPDPCTIRDYRDADEAGVLAMMRDLQRHERQFDERVKPPQEIGGWYIQELLASVDKHKGRLLVAEVDGVVVGYACLLVEVSSADQREEDPLHFQSGLRSGRPQCPSRARIGPGSHRGMRRDRARGWAEMDSAWRACREPGRTPLLCAVRFLGDVADSREGPVVTASLSIAQARRMALAAQGFTFQDRTGATAGRDMDRMSAS